MKILMEVFLCLGRNRKWIRRIQRDGVRTSRQKKYILRKRSSVGNGNTAAENSGGSEERYEFQEPDIRENENPGITIVNEANLTETPVPTKTASADKINRFSHRHWRQVHLQYRLRD